MRKLLFLCTLCCTIGLSAQIYEPITWQFEHNTVSDTTGEIIIKAIIDDSWHLYSMELPEGGPKPTNIVFDKVENATLIGSITSASPIVEEYDANFDMNLSWYNNEAVFTQKTSFTDASAIYISGYVEYMACNDKTCLPPTEETFSIGKATNTEKTVTDTLTATTLFQPMLQTDYWKPVIQELQAYGNDSPTSDHSFWWIFLTGFVGGLLALLTPCVWPIIPMTVSFFLKRADNKARGKRDAILYGISIVVIYLLLGILITVIFGASALNSLSTNAFFNLFFFALLVVFAISFFGAFEITLPSKWSTAIDNKAEKTSGLLSIFLMAFTLALVSFSCTGPIIGFLLVEIASQSLLAPAIGMLGFAIALAIPFSLFAFFPTLLKSLPKSGGWLNVVKVVLAFIELAFSLKFLSVADLAYGWHILDREVFIALWIIIFFLLGLYLLGKLRFEHDSEIQHVSVPRLFLAMISLAFSVYMIPGLWGAPLKAISAFAPPLHTQDFNLYDNEVHALFTDYEEGMDHAARTGKKVIVDFSGYGCVNCRKMEATVWTDPTVRNMLEKDFVLITLYVDDKTPLKEPFTISENGKTRTLKTVGDKWSYLQRSKFGANAQPFYVMLDHNGNPLAHSYTFDENPDNFVKWLKR